MSTFKIILINVNIIFPMCRMMAPMGNGDLGHHPEKMLPPPEAPDIQVDIVKKNSNRTTFYEILSDFPHKQQGACGWRPRRKPLWRLEALRLRGGIELNDWSNIFQPVFQGDGNSGGSLSSLNSGTDDADLEFEYLHNFGPRFAMMILLIIHSKNTPSFNSLLQTNSSFTSDLFRFKKLADMYGRESDSDESEVSPSELQSLVQLFNTFCTQEGPDFDNPSFYPKPQQQQQSAGDFS